MDDDDEVVFKIVVIGSVSTGKTNLATRYVRNEYTDVSKATIGVQFLSKSMIIHGQNIKITLWDTAGQQKYKSLSKVYYKGASGIIIVYSVTDPQTYLDVESWMKLASENVNINQVVLMVVGNKVDLEDQRKVTADRPINEFQKKFDIDCWETSAKTGYNVDKVFNQLIEKIYQSNIGAKTQLKFDESVADSVANTIVAPRDTLNAENANNKAFNRISKQKIRPVVLQQEEPAVAMPKKKQNNNEPPSSPAKQKQKEVPKKIIKPKKDAPPIKLTENKTKKVQKNQGCCS